VLDRGVGSIGTGSSGNAIGQFCFPLGTSLCPPSRTYPGGLLFVADRDNHRMQVFNATTLEHVRTIGTGAIGNGVYTSSYPCGVAFLSSTEAFPDGLLFVSDYMNDRVQIFNLTTWALLRSITSGINRPHGVAVLQPNRDYPEGLLFVSNYCNHCVKVVNAVSGKHLFTIGEEDSAGSAVGQLYYPEGIALQLPSEASPMHLLYVTEGNKRVQVFNALTGKHVRMLGAGRGSGPGQFSGPNGVAVQPANAKHPGGAVYVAELDNKRVQVFHAITGQYLGILPGPLGKAATGVSVCSDSQDRNLVFVTNFTKHNMEIFLDA
jgi:DNA-binding beta-propeller fold protein YncE